MNRRFIVLPSKIGSLSVRPVPSRTFAAACCSAHVPRMNAFVYDVLSPECRITRTPCASKGYVSSTLTRKSALLFPKPLATQKRPSSCDEPHDVSGVFVYFNESTPRSSTAARKSPRLIQLNNFYIFILFYFSYGINIILKA
jgi:hypothetical protein